MSSRWEPQDRLSLVAAMARRSGSATESFFGAHGLGAAYARPGKYSSKESRINSALLAAEGRGDVEIVLDAARLRFQAEEVPTPQAAAAGADDVVEVDVDVEALAGPIFISHASPDEPLATLLKETLIRGGVLTDGVFYSSERSSGIPLGQDVRRYLQKSLQDASIVLELITPSFLERPYCLMELGGAWVLEKPVFPIVVPPMTREEVVRNIGDVQLALMADDASIEDLMAELHDGIRAHCDVDLSARTWAGAVRRFKAEFPAIVRELAGGTGPPRRVNPATGHAGRAESSDVQLDGLVASNFSVVDGRFATELHGEVRNTSAVRRSAVLKAAFYGDTGRIIGTAGGIASEVDAGQTKTFTLSSLEPVRDFVRYSVQIETVF